MKLWRIAAATRQHAATDLSGAGAARYPGRWNDHTEPVVYCAPTLALAVLETAAHIDDAGFPQNRYVVEISVPELLWSQREVVAPGKLPATWDAIPAGHASVRFGSEWLQSRRSLLLTVPSVIVPEESCALINPRHRLASRLRAKAVRRFEYGRLFRPEHDED